MGARASARARGAEPGCARFRRGQQLHLARRGKPRFKPVARGLRSISVKDGRGALRPFVDRNGRLVGLQWGAGFVIPIAAAAKSGRRGKEQLVELAEIEALIAGGQRVVHADRAHGDRRSRHLPHATRHRRASDPQALSWRRAGVIRPGTVEHCSGCRAQRRTWTGWVQPLADRIGLDTAQLRRAQRQLDRQHRAGSPGCFHPNGTHKTGGCTWRRSRGAERTKSRVSELHRRLAGHRKTLHGALANRLFAHGADMACEKLDYIAWQKNFPRSVRDRAPGMLVETVRRKAASAGGDALYEFNPNTTALSQTCLCGDRTKKPLSQRIHRCGCGIKEHRDLFSAYLGLHVRASGDGLDRLDLEAANTGWLHRQDIDALPRPSRPTALNRRGRRHPPMRRSVARIKARRKARAVKRQSGSARTSTTNRPTALPHEQRDSRTADGIPVIHGREDVNRLSTRVADLPR